MARFDHRQIDDLIHSRIRLAVMSVLAGLERADFNFVKDKVNTTDGNLSTHLRKLEDRGYIRVDKQFEGRKPVTYLSMTDDGKEAFERYVSHLESLLNPQ